MTYLYISPKTLFTWDFDQPTVDFGRSLCNVIRLRHQISSKLSCGVTGHRSLFSRLMRTIKSSSKIKMMRSQMLVVVEESMFKEYGSKRWSERCANMKRSQPILDEFTFTYTASQELVLFRPARTGFIIIISALLLWGIIGSGTLELDNPGANTSLRKLVNLILPMAVCKLWLEKLCFHVRLLCPVQLTFLYRIARV